MKLSSRCVPLGALAYENIELTTRMMVKLFEQAPFLPLLPKISADETLVKRTLDGIPGIKIKDKKVSLKVGTNSYKQGMLKLDKAFTNPDKKNLEQFAIESVFLDKFLQIIKRVKPENVYINFLGPFTISQMLTSAAEEQMLVDKTFRKLFIQSVCVKALWIIDKVKEISSTTMPIIVLEEPLLGQLGVIKKENLDVTNELVTNMFTRVFDKIKSAGAEVAVQSMEKCDWQIPINAGVDMISFDAYNNPNNLCIIPDVVTDFINRGGKINWAIIPVMTESVVKALNIDYVASRLFATMEGLILAGVSERAVYNSATVSIQGNVDKLPIIFAEKALILSAQLAKRIPIKS